MTATIHWFKIDTKSVLTPVHATHDIFTDETGKD